MPAGPSDAARPATAGWAATWRPEANVETLTARAERPAPGASTLADPTRATPLLPPPVPRGKGSLPLLMKNTAATRTAETRTIVVPSTSQVTLLRFNVFP